MSADFDVCVIGSGGGGGPVAFALSEAGYRVVVLEKGPWLSEQDFTKDEVAECRRPKWTPRLFEEPHVVETRDANGAWSAFATPGSPYDLWNGVAVGGATNVMSGFFLRLKPDDFRLRSAYGPIEGADVEDWPISYDDLEPYYDRVEKTVGVSGLVVKHPRADRRSTPDFPFPPTAEHPFAARLDAAATSMGLHPIPLPRAILSVPWKDRDQCVYSGHCGSYGCATRAKGSSRVAFVDPAVATGRCEVRPNSTVTRLESDRSGRVVAARYRDSAGVEKRVDAKVYVVACQAIETSRLLLLSTGPRHPNGLANGSRWVGRAILFSPAGTGVGDFAYAKFTPGMANEVRDYGPFVNRTLHDWYEIADPATGRRAKGGAIDFLLAHPNPISASLSLATWDGVAAGERPIWGWPLKRKLERYFRETQHLKFETFTDWLPMPDCRVTLDPDVTDRWGVPVARIGIPDHPRHGAVASVLCRRGAEVLSRMGAENVRTFPEGAPSTNLQAGGCRFGRNPARSVLDSDCRAHEVENLFVTDGSFMPTGGSVPYTFTIYANALRVSERIVAQLGGRKAR